MSSDLQGALLSPWALGLFGLCIGSFLNVVIHRLPQMMERAWRLESADLVRAFAFRRIGVWSAGQSDVVRRGSAVFGKRRHARHAAACA